MDGYLPEDRVKGQEMKNIRQRMGLERLEFARLLGYTGSDRNDVTRIRQYEAGRNGKQIPLYIARLVWLIAYYQRRIGAMPEFPHWPGYEFTSTPDPEHQKAKHNGDFY